MATDAPPRDFSDLAKELGDKIVSLTLKDAKELSDYLEEVHGIKPAAGGAVIAAMPGAGGGAAGPAAAEKTEFDVVLEGFWHKKIGVIKVVRGDGPGLKEAKDSSKVCRVSRKDCRKKMPRS